MSIVLFVFLLFMALTLSGKVKVHVAAMAIPVILSATGILCFEEAWAGLSNATVITMAAMFVVGAAISKTSIIHRLSDALIKPGATDLQIMLGLMVTTVFLGCFLNAAATMTIMVPLITVVCAEHKRPLSKFAYPTCVLAQLWKSALPLPLGRNATQWMTQNTIIENLGGIGTFSYFDFFFAEVPTLILVTLVILFVTIKIAPDNGDIPNLADVEAAQKSIETNKVKYAAKMTEKQEKLTAAVFVGVVIGMVICGVAGKSTAYPAMIGALVLVLSGVLSDREAIQAMGSPIVFLFVGTLPLSTALHKTGGDAMIADAFQNLTGGMHPTIIMILIYLVCFVLTQFVNNSAVNAAFSTLAAMIAIQSGYDPRGLMLAVDHGANNCYLTPVAAPAMTMGFETGHYKMKQYFTMGIWLCLAHFIGFALWVPFVFPIQ